MSALQAQQTQPPVIGMSALNIDGDITLEEFTVINARGMERDDGGIVWQGHLQLRGVTFARFINCGDGGCNKWDVAPHGKARVAMAVFERLARAKRPRDPEAQDNVVGKLWDAACLAGK